MIQVLQIDFDNVKCIYIYIYMYVYIYIYGSGDLQGSVYRDHWGDLLGSTGITISGDPMSTNLE